MTRSEEEPGAKFTKGASRFDLDVSVNDTGHTLVFAPTSSGKSSTSTPVAQAGDTTPRRWHGSPGVDRPSDGRERALGQLRPQLQWLARCVRSVYRALSALFSLLTSGPFLVVLSTPFALWSVLLMSVQQQYPDKTALAVAAGPMTIVATWSVLALMWSGVSAAAGRVRHGLAVVLGVAALVIVTSYLPRVPTDRPGAAQATSHP